MSTQSDLQQLPYIQALTFLCPPCMFGGVFNLACMITCSPACALAYTCGVPLPLHQDLKTSGGMNLAKQNQIQMTWASLHQPGPCGLWVLILKDHTPLWGSASRLSPVDLDFVTSAGHSRMRYDSLSHSNKSFLLSSLSMSWRWRKHTHYQLIWNQVSFVMTIFVPISPVIVRINILGICEKCLVSCTSLLCCYAKFSMMRVHHMNLTNQWIRIEL